MALSDDLVRIATVATAFAKEGEAVAAILVIETPSGERTYLCAFEEGNGRSWLGLDDSGEPVLSRNRVREAVSVAALQEIALDASSEADDGPRVGTLASIDELGARDPNVAAAIRGAVTSIDELAREIEANYKLSLSDR